MEKHIQEMLVEGVISPSNSPWAAPVVLAPKKDGTIRFCVDYWALNEVTKKDVYTLPRVDEVLDALGNSKYRTTLDLVSGYWQTPVQEEDREKTAFITRSGLCNMFSDCTDYPSRSSPIGIPDLLASSGRNSPEP